MSDVRYEVTDRSGREVSWAGEGRTWRLLGFRVDGVPIVELTTSDGARLRASVAELRALRGAVDALLGAAPPAPPPSARRPLTGRAWSEAEDAALVSAFEAGRHLADLAADHGRTTGAIHARVVKLGLLPTRQDARRLAATQRWERRGVAEE